MAPADTATQDLDTHVAPAPTEVQMEVDLLAVDAIPAPADDAPDPPEEHADEALDLAGQVAAPATTDIDASEHNAVEAATTEQPAPAMGKIDGGWGYVYAAYGVTWTCLALYVAYLVIYRRMQSSGGNP